MISYEEFVRRRIIGGESLGEILKDSLKLDRPVKVPFLGRVSYEPIKYEGGLQTPHFVVENLE